MAKSGRPKAKAATTRAVAFPVDDSFFVQAILHRIGILKLLAADNEREQFLEQFVDLRERTNKASHALRPFQDRLVKLRPIGAPHATIGTVSASSAHALAMLVSSLFRLHVAGNVMTTDSYPDWCFDQAHFTTAVSQQWEQVRGPVLTYSFAGQQAAQHEFTFSDHQDYERSIQPIVLDIERERLALSPTSVVRRGARVNPGRQAAGLALAAGKSEAEAREAGAKKGWTPSAPAYRKLEQEVRDGKFVN